MSDKPRTKASYAKPTALPPYSKLDPITLAPFGGSSFRPINSSSSKPLSLTPYKTSTLISPTTSYAQAAQKQSTANYSPNPSLSSPTSEQIRNNPSKQTSFGPYLSKTCSKSICLLEKDEMDENQIPILSRIFPSVRGKIVQYYLPRGYQTPLKTQEYYEFILVDTDSADIIHTTEPDSEVIAFSKCKIKRFITKEEWGNPFQPRKFSQNYEPSQYNYFDYQEAWYKALYIKPANHSWFFNFHQKFNKKIPNWVHQWWIYFGLTEDIFPEIVKNGWKYFQEHLQTALYGNKAIMFSIEFQVPWILAWDFSVSKTLDQQFPIMLERKFRLKWWKNFKLDDDKFAIDNINRWLISHDNTRQFPTPKKTTAIPSSLSKKELKKKLLEEISQLGDSSDEDADISSSQPVPANQICFQDAQDPYEDYDII